MSQSPEHGSQSQPFRGRTERVWPGNGEPPPVPPGSGQPPPGYGQPPPGHGQGPPGWGQPPPGYGQPPPGHGQGPPGWGQPPPVPPGWGQPPPGYGQPPPGYGQPPPGYGQWPAPAPAPGGVPLRPLGVGEILSGAFTLIRRNLVATLGTAAIIAIISAAVSTPLSWAELRLAHHLQTSITPQTQPTQATQALSHFFPSFFVFLIATLVIAYVGQAILTGMLTGALGRALIGDNITIGQAWRIARIPAVLGATLLLSLIWIGLLIPVIAIVTLLAVANFGGLAIFVAVVGGIGTVVVEIYLYVRLLVTVPAVVLEGSGPIATLGRSWNLVRGSFWRVFGISLLTYLIVVFIAYILKLPFTILGLLVTGHHATSSASLLAGSATPSLVTLTISAIGGIVALTCTAPISAGVTTLIYADLRMRREGLDLALQQAGQEQSLTGQQFTDLWQRGLPGQPGTRW